MDPGAEDNLLHAAAAVSVYDDFTHPQPSPCESIVRDVTVSNLTVNTKGLTIDDIVDNVKNTISTSDSSIQLPNDDIIAALVRDVLDENCEHITQFNYSVSVGLKYTFSYTYRVRNVLEELANNAINGETYESLSAEAIVSTIKKETTNGNGRVNEIQVKTALFQGVKDGLYICNNNRYKIKPLISGEKNQIMDMKEKLSVEVDDNNESSEEKCHPPVKKKRKTIKTKKISKRDINWNNMVEKLRVYKFDKGDTNVPRKYSADRSLGKWVDTQRTEYRRKKLSDDRTQKLKSIGFVFDLEEDAWTNMFKKLKAYKDDKGDTNVPQQYSSDPSLANWVVTQRRTYRHDTGRTPLSVVEKAAAVNGWCRVVADDKEEVLTTEPRENEDTNLPPLIVLK